MKKKSCLILIPYVEKYLPGVRALCVGKRSFKTLQRPLLLALVSLLVLAIRLGLGY